MPSSEPESPPTSEPPSDGEPPSSPVNDATEPVSPSPRSTRPTMSAENGHGGSLAKLSLGALGVVYGDIGTSPLYAIQECFHQIKKDAQESGGSMVVTTPENVYGILSLVFWALLLIIVVKYISFIMRADNKGEGGVLTLCALVMRFKTDRVKWASFATLCGLFGAGLLYGDGAITPAISILGALKGLEHATESLRPLIVPLAVVILLLLFLVQRFGTAKIGSVFGWIMLLWFVAIGISGTVALIEKPSVLVAVNPIYGFKFLFHGGWKAFLFLGSVVLVVTGGEALYADMGHFGRRPIRFAWYAVVMPGLLLNYFGQGAILLTKGEMAVDNPFYALTPGYWLYPMLILATAAAIIASQALITGAFSLTRTAVQLGYFPRVRIVHTSEESEGQIYIPEINWILMSACIALVIFFQSADRLAAAYGIAVTGTMAITSFLFYGVARSLWKWSWLKAISLSGFFFLLDAALFAANVHKIEDGGWFPLAVGVWVFVIMTTWRKGRVELSRVFSEGTLPDELFLADMEANAVHRVTGTAVFMTSNVGGIPPVLLHHVKHNKILHEQVVLLSIVVEEVPIMSLNKNLEVRSLGQGFYRVVARYGFMQSPHVPRLLARCTRLGLRTNADDTSYFLGRETLLVTGKSKMAKWRKILFAFLQRNSRSATMFFGLPPNRVVELGAQIEL